MSAIHLMAIIAVGLAIESTAFIGLTPRLPACPSDAPDSTPICVWDAPSQGNGTGTSFIKVGPLYIYL